MDHTAQNTISNNPSTTTLAKAAEAVVLTAGIDTSDLGDELLPLYDLRPGQDNPLGANLLIPHDEPAYFEVDSPDGSVSESLYHGLDVRVSVNPMASRDDLLALANDERVRGLIGDVQAGNHVKWNGSNWVGNLDDAAGAALEELGELLGQINQAKDAYYVEEWLEGVIDGGVYPGETVNLERFGTITWETTDEEFEAISEAIEAEARECGEFLLDDPLEVLKGLLR